MADIGGGGLSFEATMDNSKINSSIEETLRRLNGLSDGTASSSAAMDGAIGSSSEKIRRALGQIGQACDDNEKQIQSLEAEYIKLGEVGSAAFSHGKDVEFRAIEKQKAAIKGEIALRRDSLKALRELSNEFEKRAQKIEEDAKKTETAAQAQVSYRTKIRLLKEALIEMEMYGQRGTAVYEQKRAELAKLTDAMGDASQQARLLAHDNAGLQGFISGLSGLAGGFSAATGAMSLFAGENEDLQKIMTKLQSVMAISMGVQQVANTLNKDSAFMLGVVGKAKQWYAGIVAKATVTEVANTAATGAQTVAATAGTAANIGLAGAFRAVGAAIMSIPVFGWILAGIAGITALVVGLTSKSREAAKEQEKFAKALSESAYEPIGKIEMLSAKWEKLGNDLKAKQQFIEQNKKAFEDLGQSIHSVADAENLLIKNKEAFINAQISKAKAAIIIKGAEEKIKEQLKLQQEIEAMPNKTPVYSEKKHYDAQGKHVLSTYKLVESEKDKKIAELKKLEEATKKEFESAASEEEKGWSTLEQANLSGTKNYAKGTIGYLEKAISERKDKLKELLPSSSEFKTIEKEIKDFEKQLSQITGKSAKKDEFSESLKKIKNEYQRFSNYVNSGDDTLVNIADKEFSVLLSKGKNYIDYLKNQRDEILKVNDSRRTKVQNEQLRALNDQLAEETKKMVLESFNSELSDQLSNAKSVLAMLDVIEQKRNLLNGDNTELGDDKRKSLDKKEADVLSKIKDEYTKAAKEHSDYLDSKIKADVRYFEERKRLEEQLITADDPKKREVIQTQIKTLDIKEQLRAEVDYAELLKEYHGFEEKKKAINADFESKKQKATEKGNIELYNKLAVAQKKAIDQLSVDELMSSGTWQKLFSNLDNLTVSEMIKLRDKLENDWEKLNLSPEQLNLLRNKISEVTNEISAKNPFLALLDSIKKYNAEGSKLNFKEIAKAASDSIKLISGTFDAVIDGIKKVGGDFDEETNAIISDIGGILDGAGNIATGLATGNPLSIIQGTISVITSAIDLFDTKSRNANKEIKRHAENIKNLEKSYNDLERAVDKALGTSKYDVQKKQIDNLKQQQQELAEMSSAESSKKKTDQGKLNEYSDSAKANAIKMAEIVEGMRESITGNARSIANDLGNAFIDAMGAGENALDAFNKKADNVVANIIRKLLIEKLLEQPIGNIIGKYQNKIVSNDGTFAGSDAAIGAVKDMGEELKGVGGSFASAMDALPEEIKKYFIGEGTGSNTSLTGAVKGVTEETASLVAGQMNAIRLNQVESTEMIRQQLFHLTAIAQNTSYLLDIRNDIKAIRGSSSDGGLRASGL